jgi:glycosyltransferase involved in cell wall biosynthesis
VRAVGYQFSYGNSVFMKTCISVVAGCYNEEGNIEALYDRICNVFSEDLAEYQLELIFIDNASVDGTQEILRKITERDSRVKAIFNMRNFGIARSGMHVLMQATGDAVVGMASDLQDPPELIPALVSQWKLGYSVVFGQKKSSEESVVMFNFRRLFYKTINYLSESPLPQNVTGFGLFDRKVVESLRQIDDRDAYLRGLIVELGYPVALVEYVQPKRLRGRSSYRFLDLWGVAMNALVSHSKVPLRIATLLGAVMSLSSGIVGCAYLVYKLFYWETFQAGTMPILLGMLFIGAVQLTFLGVIGEYVGSIHSRVRKAPLVVERERINF